MGYYLEINAREINSKVTSGLMATIIRTVIGPRDELIDGWSLTTKHVALLIANMSVLHNKESFDAFVEQHKDSYWANSITKHPDIYRDTVSHIRDVFAETLANMVLDGKDVILARWE